MLELPQNNLYIFLVSHKKVRIDDIGKDGDARCSASELGTDAECLKGWWGKTHLNSDRAAQSFCPQLRHSKPLAQYTAGHTKTTGLSVRLLKQAHRLAVPSILPTIANSVSRKVTNWTFWWQDTVFFFCDYYFYQQKYKIEWLFFIKVLKWTSQRFNAFLWWLFTWKFLCCKVKQILQENVL